MNIGVDIIHISRMKEKYDKYGNKFLERFMNDSEMKELESLKDKPRYAAKCWAVKEAAIKASNIVNPKFFSYTKVKNIPTIKTDISGDWKISISDEKDTVVAVVMRFNND